MAIHPCIRKIGKAETSGSQEIMGGVLPQFKLHRRRLADFEKWVTASWNDVETNKSKQTLLLYFNVMQVFLSIQFLIKVACVNLNVWTLLLRLSGFDYRLDKSFWNKCCARMSCLSYSLKLRASLLVVLYSKKSVKN